MSVKDVVKSLLTEVKGPVTARARKEPAAGVDDGSLSAGETPKPNEPDPEQVQYPGYFKDGGSL
ncbi:MAG TPA: hypothetical protein VL202_08680 [Pararhizobium sp.]|uniref:hypothetical protein n=1 Tax=Pararhizobium sp. TaxID=1977563 RepID=UPI002B9D07EB|nr:hypothetical protein [Pararhizobium sp.]HTO31237.1 hypothetical protein [Pararhizobium sp.]